MTETFSADALDAVQRRLELAATGLLDTPAEDRFDRYTRLAARLTDAPVTLVSLVDRDRQFFKSQLGLPDPWASLCETPLSHSFCRHVVELREPLVVEDAREHPLVRDNLAIRDLGVVAYLGVPLVTPRGIILGALCAIDGRPRAWSEGQVGAMTDLARALMSEVALRELSLEALQGLRVLHELEHQRDDMVHMLVHDLRNPLASMLAGLDMLDAIPGLTEKHRKYVERSRSGGRTLLEMINEILTVSRSDAGMLKLDLAALSAGQLIDQAVDGVAHLASAAAVQVTRTVPRALPQFVGDAAKLNRVLVNLIANALAHTPRQGQVEVAVELRSDGALGFTVADTGPGIAEADLERIFEKYEQGRSARSTRSSGSSSGMGLAFCKAVVEGHGGRIWAENATAGGAALRFTLPAASDVS